MTSSQSSMADELLTVRRAVRSHATLFLAQGVIITLLGVAAVIWPHLSSLAVDIFLGWVFLFSGIVGLGLMLLAPNASSFLWSLLTGALALFAGVVLLWHPAQGVVSLTLVLVAFFIVEGLFQIAAALAYRSIFPESWGWMLFSGIIDLILAGLIVAGLPGAAGWALGLIAGVNLISSGLAIIIVALTVQRAAGIVEKALR